MDIISNKRPSHPVEMRTRRPDRILARSATLPGQENALGTTILLIGFNPDKPLGFETSERAGQRTTRDLKRPRQLSGRTIVPEAHAMVEDSELGERKSMRQRTLECRARQLINDADLIEEPKEQIGVFIRDRLAFFRVRQDGSQVPIWEWARRAWRNRP